MVDISFDIRPVWETFNPSLFDSTYHDMDFYDKVWAGIKYATSTNTTLNEKYGNSYTLTEDDALPRQKALMFFYGPLALSRDIRVSEGNIFSPVSEPENQDMVSAKIVKAPENIWKEFELNLGNDRIIRFCDFSSAGNTWDKYSLFNTWCLVEK